MRRVLMQYLFLKRIYQLAIDKIHGCGTNVINILYLYNPGYTGT